MTDVLRPATTTATVRPSADRPVVRQETQSNPVSATKGDEVRVSPAGQTTPPGLRRLPTAVAAQFHPQGVKPVRTPCAPTEPCPVPMTLETALNPLNSSGVVGRYVQGLAELSGTPAKTAKWLVKLGDDLQDPTLTATDRVVMIRKHTQATAKLLYTATALPAVWTSVSNVLPGWLSGGKFALEVSQCHRILTNVMNVARPVADGVLFIGDAANLKQKITDPQATTGQIGRAAVDTGLDVARLVTYALPKTGPVKTVATVALLARTGLSIYDMMHPAAP